jgi:hypothetical protein
MNLILNLDSLIFTNNTDSTKAFKKDIQYGDILLKYWVDSHKI